jgi:hypothetical protein
VGIKVVREIWGCRMGKRGNRKGEEQDCVSKRIRSKMISSDQSNSMSPRFRRQNLDTSGKLVGGLERRRSIPDLGFVVESLGNVESRRILCAKHEQEACAKHDYKKLDSRNRSD